MGAFSSETYSSMMTWALAPPAPNDEIPAILGYSWVSPSSSTTGRFHSSSSCWTTNGVCSKGMFGFSSWACRLGTSVRFFICRTIFPIPAMPAAASKCPMLDFTEPTAQNPLSAVSFLKAWVRPVTSMGSPSSVPVPCASI
ncbi:hypothetical protein D1872_219550 [compost metagenome]